MYNAITGKRGARFLTATLMLSIAMAVGSDSAKAAAGSNRVAHFFATGQSFSKSNTLRDTNQAMCVVTITNPSPNRQIARIQIQATWSGTASGTSPSAADTTYTLDQHQTVSHTMEMVTIPANLIQTYELVCKGSITVYDNDSTAPGFVVASGTLESFTENGRAQSMSGGGLGQLTGSGSTSYIPIAISEGRPF